MDALEADRFWRAKIALESEELLVKMRLHCLAYEKRYTRQRWWKDIEHRSKKNVLAPKTAQELALAMGPGIGVAPNNG